jgi:hypothetical protein
MFPEELRDLTYPRLNLNDHTLDENLPQFPSQNGRLEAKANAGIFETLPLEILQDVLVQLDLRSLMNFRYVNKRAVELVASLPQYITITKHAQNALCGILCIQTGVWITCEMLYKKLFIHGCEECGDFAAYLYIITCKRVCFLCLSEKPSYLPIGADLIKWRYGLDRRKIQILPHMKTLPGIYSPGERKFSRSITLFDFDSILRIAIEHHGSLDAVKGYIADIRNQMREEYASRRESALRAGSDLSRVRSPACLFPCDRKSSNPVRFVAVVTAPCLSKGSAKAEAGFYCKGCRNSNDLPRHWRRRFTAASFTEHLRECGNILNERHQLP